LVEDNDFETEFCEYNNTLNLNDNDYINIDCNRWISFFKTLRQAVLNIVPTSTSVPRTSGGRKSSSKRQRRARKTNKNQRSRRKSMKKIHRRK
jgi:hypothetical protein